MFTILLPCNIWMFPGNYNHNRNISYISHGLQFNPIKLTAEFGDPTNYNDLPKSDDIIKKYNDVMGYPENFIKNLQDQSKTNLNEFMGLAVSTVGFILAIRSLIK